jgi:hypothetical protein
MYTDGKKFQQDEAFKYGIGAAVGIQHDTRFIYFALHGLKQNLAYCFEEYHTD